MAPTILDSLVDPSKDLRPIGMPVVPAEPVPARSVEDSICRDLQWLFNTTSLECVFENLLKQTGKGPADIGELQELRRSVLNYGVRALTGRISSDLDSLELRSAVREAIERFEPRLELEDVQEVRTGQDEGDDTGRTKFLRVVTIVGRTRQGGRLELETEVDLARGFARVTRRGSGARLDR